MENGEQCDSFPLLKSHLSSLSGNPSLHCGVQNVIYSHLDSLISHFDKYFSEDIDKYKWIRNLFSEDIDKYKWIRNNAIASQGFTSLEAQQFIDLSSDLTSKSIYSADSITSFWIMAQFEFPLVNCKGLHIFMPFATSYL